MINKTVKTEKELFEIITQEIYKQLSKHLNGCVTITEYKELIAVQINVYAIHYNEVLYKIAMLETLANAPCLSAYVDSVVTIIMEDYCDYICDRFFK